MFDVAKAQTIVRHDPIEFSNEFALSQDWEVFERRLSGYKGADCIAIEGRGRDRVSEGAPESLQLIFEKSGPRPTIAINEFGRKPLNKDWVEWH